MANLYILPDSWLIALILWTFLSLVAESFLVYYQSPLPSFQNTRQRLVEGAQLLLLLLILTFSMTAWAVTAPALP